MGDLGQAYTDKEIEKLTHKINGIYKEARKDINRKMKDFNEKYKVKEAKYAQQVKDGKITQEQFDKWKKGQVFQGKQWQAKKQEIENVLHNSNVIASQAINSERVNVFGFNMNYASYSIEHGTGVNFGFSLYDRNTVINLIKNEPNLLPAYTPKRGLDNAWNSKQITRQITQGIIQGESLNQIADRLAKVTSSQDRNSMLTHARTLMTGAQNAGRLESYRQAEKLGIDMEKEWMATLDSHTRDSHADVDGERQPVEHKFSNDCMYPGDPGGPPAETYNCRCTMVSNVKKYPANYQRRDNIDGKPINNVNYRDWAEAKGQKRGGVPKTKDTPIVARIQANPQQASEDWFEYENANVMREYIRTGEIPTTDTYGYDIDKDTREQLAAEADLMQSMGSVTKTDYKTLYRGMVLDENEVRTMFTPNETYTFDTLSSTATDAKIAQIYTNVDNSGLDNGVPVVIEIQKSDGIYGFDRDGAEIVIPRGSEFRVTRNWMDENGVVHVSLYSKKGNNISNT